MIVLVCRSSSGKNNVNRDLLLLSPGPMPGPVQCWHCPAQSQLRMWLNSRLGKCGSVSPGLYLLSVWSPARFNSTIVGNCHRIRRTIWDVCWLTCWSGEVVSRLYNGLSVMERKPFSRHSITPLSSCLSLHGWDWPGVSMSQQLT